MRTIVLFVLLLAQLQVPAQYCNYSTLLTEGKAFLDQKAYKKALNKFNAAKTCDISHAVEVDKLLTMVYNAIEQEKIDAVIALQKYKQEQSARLSCEKQEKFIQSVNQALYTTRDLDNEYNVLYGRLKDDATVLDSLERKYKRLVHLKNNSIAALFKLKAVYIKKQDYAEVEKLCTQILDIDPEFYAARSDRATNYARLKQHGKAIADYSFILAEGLDSSTYLVNRASAYLMVNQPKKCIDDMTTAIGLQAGEKDPFLWKSEAYFQRGKAWEAISEWDKALDDYEMAVELDSTDVFAWVSLGQMYYYRSRDDKALEAFGKALYYDPDFGQGYTARAPLYQKQGKYQLALEDCNRAIKIDPDNYFNYRAKASTLVIMNHLEEALAEINKAIQLSPISDASLYTLRAEIYGSMDQKQKALDDVETAINLAPNDPGVLNTQGMTLYRQGLADSALQVFSRVIKINPNDFTSYYYRGMIHFLKADYASSKGDFDTAILLNPAFASSYAERADVWLALGNPDNALKDIERALQRDSTSFPILLASHRTYNVLDWHVKSVDALTKALKIRPEGFVYEARAWGNYKLGLTEKAFSDVDSALMLSPNLQASYKLRSKLNSYSGKWDACIADATVFLEMFPDDGECLFNRGVSYSKTGRYTLAFNDLTELIEKNEIWGPYAYPRRGEVRRKLKEYDLARKDIQMALELTPDVGGVNFFMAMLEAELGNEQACFEQLELAVTKPIPYPLKKRITDGDEPILKHYRNDPRFQAIVQKAKD